MANLKMNDNVLLALADKANRDHAMIGYLYKRTADSTKWQLRWFTLYQNLLFYHETQGGRVSGVIFLEGCYCERLISTCVGKREEKQHCFAVMFRKEGLRQYDLRAETESSCNAWIEAIRQASFNKVVLLKEELEQKHLHLLQIVESEKTAKWQYTQQCEELTVEIKKLRAELCALKRELRLIPGNPAREEESDEIRKIKKVQSFFRGWLCRRRWKQIVEEYIHSPHAENMRKRNSLVFCMVEAEEEYLEQLQLLVSCFLRPFKMVASSKSPPCSHDDVNSIFLNSETIMFLHQIFLKGLTARMENWPTLVLGDLFDMLLPMLSIYQEYVRNHHYSLQVLAECKQNPPFVTLLKRLEEKPSCQGRSLETFLTYPMHQIPRYIITLHELLAHTPHNHVERRSLDNARTQLEELSRQMHDEVSETENIRKNLAIERMIVEGCDILLDVNQVFVRQGTLIQLPVEKAKGQRNRLASSFKGSEKETPRQCYLFSNHMILTTRTSAGRLHLVPTVGKLSLADATLIEDPSEQTLLEDDGDSSVCSLSSQSSSMSESSSSAIPRTDYHNRDFKLVVDVKNGPPMVVHMMAPTMQEKAAWISDITHCMDNVHFNDLFNRTASDTSSVTMPQSIRNDPRLYKDDVDIRFSRTMNSCKVPQIRYATPERLLERLTDLRFLSIDFLNTFLLTYRVFSDSVTLLEALKRVYYNPEVPETLGGLETTTPEGGAGEPNLSPPEYDSLRRISTSSMTSSEAGDWERERERSMSHDARMGPPSQHWRWSHRKFEEEQQQREVVHRSLKQVPPAFEPSFPSPVPATSSVPDTAHPSQEGGSANHLLNVPATIVMSTSSETLTDTTTSTPSSPTILNLSSNTLVALAHEETDERIEKDLKVDVKEKDIIKQLTPKPPLAEDEVLEYKTIPEKEKKSQLKSIEEKYVESDTKLEQENVQKTKRQDSKVKDEDKRQEIESPVLKGRRKSLLKHLSSTDSTSEVDEEIPVSPPADTVVKSPPPIPGSYSTHLGRKSAGNKRGSTDTTTESSVTSPRSSFQHSESPQHSSKAGVVITSHRASQRRSSTSSAAAAFAVATAGSSNPRDLLPQTPRGSIGHRYSTVSTDSRTSIKERPSIYKRESMICTAATMRVLSVLRHWISKHSQDFESDPRLKEMTVEFLEELVCNSNLLPVEHKAASQLLRMITREDPVTAAVDLDLLLAPPMHMYDILAKNIVAKKTPSKESTETLSALEIAEQITYLDHMIFVAIRSEEFLGQAWMKPDKTTKAPNILLITRRFNDVSRLVVSEVIRQSNIASRIAVIEKWAQVANICRCLRNFNGVLQICAAFTNSAVFRLKKTWEKVSKTTRQTVDTLQTLVSSDGRFRNLRDALHRCDPPCIPYLGMYLTDLSFIEEGTPNFTDDGLLNFSKMRMIAHVIREIRHFQQTPYKIEINPNVSNYLLDPSLLLCDDKLYRMSLAIEPRQSRLGSVSHS